MKVRDVLSCVGFGTQVALYDRRCKPVCSGFPMPLHVSDLESFDFLDFDVLLIDSLYSAKGVPVLAIVLNDSDSDWGDDNE